MSTNDVPGANPSNGDQLGMGCWAEHADGSLIFVESTEGSRVIYSIFDMSKEPPVEYRDAMPESSFKVTFTWDPKGKKSANEKWTWHDKTPFPWDKIIKAGVVDGPRYPSADHLMSAAERVVASRERHTTAAERVAAELRLRGEELDRGNLDHRVEKVLSRMEDMWGRIASALERLPGGKGKGRSARR